MMPDSNRFGSPAAGTSSRRCSLRIEREENPSCAKCDFYLSSHYTKDDIDGFDVRKLR